MLRVQCEERLKGPKKGKVATGDTLKMFTLLERRNRSAESTETKKETEEIKSNRLARYCKSSSKGDRALTSIALANQLAISRLAVSTKVTETFFVETKHRGDTGRVRRKPAFSFKGVSCAGRSIDLSSTQDRVFGLTLRLREGKGQGRLISR